MSQTAADILVDAIHDWGVEVVFGLPGDGINGVFEALRKRQDKIRFIQVRHEESAAFMACAYAKYTGKLGVCVTTSGPGGIHLLNGLYDAKLDKAPVLAITGMHYHDLIGTYAQQDLELDKVFADVARFNQRVMGPSHVEALADLACRTALCYRTVSHITFPLDFQEMEVKDSERSKRNRPHHSSDVYARSASLPSEQDMLRAAEVLNKGDKVTILIGQGALHAAEPLEQVAELLKAPIVHALLGKATLPDSSPYNAGGLGLLGTKPGQEAVENCDTLLMVGTSFPYMEFLPKPGKVRAIQIELDPMRVGLRYPVEVGLVGDSFRTLNDLIPLLRPKADGGFLTKAQDGMKEWREAMVKQETRMDLPLKPQVVAAELSKRLASDAIVSADSGTNTTWWARHIEVKRGQMHSCSGTLATMACALPYTIAAQVAFPNRQCICFAGDGGVSMLMAEIATAVKYKLPIRVVVIRNNSLGQIKWEQMVFNGNPEFACDLQPIDFAAVARACGATGFTLDNPNDCGRVFDQALAHPGPVVIDAIVDEYEAPLPPRITFAQAAHMAESLVKGEQDRGKIIKTLTKDKVKQLL